MSRADRFQDGGMASGAPKANSKKVTRFRVIRGFASSLPNKITLLNNFLLYVAHRGSRRNTQQLNLGHSKKGICGVIST
jgi:hypothetical protein